MFFLWWKSSSIQWQIDFCAEQRMVSKWDCTLGPYIRNDRFRALFRWELLATHEAHLPVAKGAKHSCWICTCLHLWLEIKITLNSKGQTIFSLYCVSALQNYWTRLGWAGLFTGPQNHFCSLHKERIDQSLHLFGLRLQRNSAIMGCLKCRCMALKCRLQSVSLW